LSVAFVERSKIAYSCKCVVCGESLPLQETGRPKQRCARCRKKYRKKYQHLAYLKRKFGNLNERELKDCELKADLKRDQRKIRRHRKWWHYYLRQRPLLWMIDTDLSFEAKEEILEPERKIINVEMAEYVKNNPLAREGLYNEPLWRPPRKKKKKTS